MNILVNCNELINPNFATIEEIGGAECYLLYHKLRLYLKENRTDKLYRAKLVGLGTALRSNHQTLMRLLEISSEVPDLIAARGQYWQFLEITKELVTLEGRVKGGLRYPQGTLNKGKGIDKGIGSIKGESPERGKQKLPAKKPEPEVLDFTSIEFPPELDNPICRDAWKNLMDYKVEIGKSYKTLRGAKMELAAWRKRPDEFPRAVEECIRRSWQGLITDKAYPPTPQHNQTRNGRPVATMNPDGSVSGEIDFNSLPASAKVGIMNKNLIKQMEELDRQDELKKLENKNDDKQKTDGNALNRILRAVPQLGTKTGRGS